jgi:hypothetical protein
LKIKSDNKTPFLARVTGDRTPQLEPFCRSLRELNRVFTTIPIACAMGYTLLPSPMAYSRIYFSKNITQIKSTKFSGIGGKFTFFIF